MVSPPEGVRSFKALREAALVHRDLMAAEALDRPPAVKFGPGAGATRRKARRLAARDRRQYAPVTEQG